MAPTTHKYRKKFRLVDEPESSLQQPTPTAELVARVQTFIQNSRNMSRVELSRRNSSLQEEQNMSQQMTSPFHRTDDHISNAQIANANIGVTRRSPVDRRIVNVGGSIDNEGSFTHHNQRHIQEATPDNEVVSAEFEQEDEEDELDLSQQRPTPTEDRIAHVQTLIPNSRNTSRVNTSRENNMAATTHKYRTKISLQGQPDMSQQRRTPTAARNAHVQTAMHNSRDRNCGNTSRGKSSDFTERTHGERNFILQDKQNMVQQRLTSTEDLIDDHTSNAQTVMPNRANTSFVLRTQVGRRIVNGAVYERGEGSYHIHTQRHPHVPSLEKELTSTNFQQENEQEDEEGSSSGDEEIVRSPTYMKSIWGRPSNLPPISVEYNQYGQPIEGETSTLSHFLGTIARNGQYCPIDVKDWHDMMKGEKKNEMLRLVKSRFHVPMIAEKWILSSIGHKWRNWKHYLKTRFWVDNHPVEHLISERDERVAVDQWIKLLTHWETTDAKKASDMNQIARSKKIHDQRTGKRSFAQVGARLTKEQGRPIDRVQLFGTCFTSKNGESSEAVRSKLSAMLERQELLEGADDSIGPDDVFAQIMGKDKPGHVRMMGRGVCPSDVWGGSSKKDANHLLMRYEAKIAELQAELATQKTYHASQLHTRQDTTAFESPSQHSMETRRTQVGTYVSLKSVVSNKVVAKGFIHCTDPSTKVGGQMLGLDWCEVNVKAVLEPKEQLIRPYGNIRELSQTVGHMIAWPCSLVQYIPSK